MPSSQLRDRKTDTWPNLAAATGALGLIVPPLAGLPMAAPPPTDILSTPIPQDPQTPSLHLATLRPGGYLRQMSFKRTDCPALIPLQDRLTLTSNTRTSGWAGLTLIGSLPDSPTLGQIVPSLHEKVTECSPPSEADFSVTGNR